MGEAPMLGHRGARLTQSGVILDYLAQSLGRFGPNDETERREILRVHPYQLMPDHPRPQGS